ncbi:hypothetical protein FOBRF1_006679 [Fusarium oxysporum]
MSYMLYLVALLQQEAESSNWDEGHDDDEDEPGDCDDGDEYEDEDNDGDGADEEYINEYDRVETGNHSDENDKNCDMSNGEDDLSGDSSYSLPSGLWLHLSEVIFQLSMMFWTYQEPTGDMSASTIIHYTAISGGEEAEASSDEESLVVMRKKQAQVVRMMETRVHELIEAHYRRYPQWKKCYDPELRELNFRLEKVE